MTAGYADPLNGGDLELFTATDRPYRIASGRPRPLSQGGHPMDSTATEKALRRKLDILLSLDMATMGYEAKARHCRRIKRAQQAYDQAANHPQAEPQSDRTLAPVD